MSLSCLFKTQLSLPHCHLCLCRNFQRKAAKGQRPIRRVDKPVRVPTPPKLVKIPPAPLAKYLDEFKEQALSNIDDWIAREEHCELFDDDEKRTYQQDLENYNLEYVKWIKNYQSELSLEQQNQSELQRNEDSENDQNDWEKILELSSKWNSSIQSEREKYIASLQNSLKYINRECESVNERSDEMNLIDSPLLDPAYLSRLIEVKLMRLDNIITEDNLDERIGAALNQTPVDFNFAIDNRGDIHKGTFFDKTITMGSSEFRSSLIRRDAKQDEMPSSQEEPLAISDDIIIDELLDFSSSSESKDQLIEESHEQTNETSKNDNDK